MKLFMVYLGGRIEGGHIEVHDVRFVVGKCIEDTYSELKKQWVGNKKQVHIDSYMAVEDIDGYKIEVVDEHVIQVEKLYFVNMGGYQNKKLAEQHEFGLFVAKSQDEAKKRAHEELLHAHELTHKDDLYDIDDCFAVDLFSAGYNIKLTPSGRSQAMHPDWFGFKPL